MKIKSLIATLVILGAAAAAHADGTRPLECGLSFTAKGGGAQVLIGKFKLSGQGMLACQDLNGDVEKIPVKVTFGGHLFALKAAVGYFNIAGVATGIGYTKSPNEILGHYVVASAEGAVIAGAGARVGFRAAHGNATINAMIQAENGIGFDVGLGTMRIERLVDADQQ